MPLETIILETGHPPKGSIIWLHGLGADGHDFVNIVPQLNLPASLPLRFIFPHAPVRPITLNANLMMRAWFDVHNLGENTLTTGGKSITTDEAGVLESLEQIHYLLDQEIEKGISSDKIILAGFSQGGSIALYGGLHFDKPLAGILALSTCLPSTDAIKNHNPENSNTPIFMAHGSYDPVIPLDLAKLTYETLKAAHIPVTMREYPIDHQVCHEEINDISYWIKSLEL